MIVLPWPPSCLSPNSRTDRRKSAAPRAKYRDDAMLVSRSHRADYHPNLIITFHAPDKRRRDLDNMLASIKSGLDGVAKGIGVDDADWSLTIRKGSPTPGGAVTIRFDPGAPVAAIPFRGAIE